MIFCGNTPSTYVEPIDGTFIGLFTNYGHDKELFNLISRVSLSLFTYELNLKDKAFALTNIEDIRETLDQEVNLKSIRHLLHELNPEAFFKLLYEQKPKHLAIAKDFDGLMLCMLLRMLMWKKIYRGPTLNSKNITNAQFKSALTVNEELFLNRSLKKMA